MKHYLSNKSKYLDSCFGLLGVFSARLNGSSARVLVRTQTRRSQISCWAQNRISPQTPLKLCRPGLVDSWQSHLLLFDISNNYSQSNFSSTLRVLIYGKSFKDLLRDQTNRSHYLPSQVWNLFFCLPDKKTLEIGCSQNYKGELECLCRERPNDCPFCISGCKLNTFNRRR